MANTTQHVFDSYLHNPPAFLADMGCVASSSPEEDFLN